MDTEEAWQQFRKGESIQKAGLDTPSLRGQLETIQAQLNEVLTNSKRTAELVPKLLGDAGAINAANEQAGMQAMMGGGMPGGMPMGDDGSAMGGMPMGAEESPEEDESEEEGADMDEEDIAELLGESGGLAPVEGGPEAEGAPMEEEGLPAEGGEELPPMEGEDEGLPLEGEEMPPMEGGEELPLEEDLGEELPPGEEGFEEEVGMEGDPVDAIEEDIKGQIHNAVDIGDYDAAEKLIIAAKAIETFAKSASMGEDIMKSEDAPQEVAVEASAGCEDKKISPKGSKPVEASGETATDSTREYRKDIEMDDEQFKNLSKDERDLMVNDAKVGAKGTATAHKLPPKKSALSEPPSFSSIMSDLRGNPKGSMYDHFLGVRKSMGLADPLSDSTSQFMKGEFPEEELPEDEADVGEIEEPEMEEDMEMEEAPVEGGDDEALIDALVQICQERGITIEQLAEMSEDQIEALIAEAEAMVAGEEPDGDEMGGEAEGDHPEPDGDEMDIDMEDTEPIQESAMAKSDDVDDMPAANPCPMRAMGGNSPDHDSIASSKPVNLTPNKSEGTSSSPAGIMPPARRTDPESTPMAEPTTGPMKDGLQVMTKSAEGKHIMSMAEMLEIRKSQSRPDSNCGTNGNISRPDLGPVKKTAEPIDYSRDGLAGFKKSVQQDWDEYKAIKAQREF